MRGISETEDGRGRVLDAVRVQDTLLESLKSRCACGFSGMVTRYCNVDDATGCDVVWEEDGGKFDLYWPELASHLRTLSNSIFSQKS